MYNNNKINNKNDNKNDNEDNSNKNTIVDRVSDIKNIILGSKLEKLNPIKDYDSYDSKNMIGNHTMDFYRVINELDCKLLYIKSGSYGHTFRGYIPTDKKNEYKNIAVKIVAYPKRKEYGSIQSTDRPENAEKNMLTLLSYFTLNCQTRHLILPILTFKTSIKPFIELKDSEMIPKDSKDKKSKYEEFIENYEKGEYYDNVSVLISEWANRGDLSMFLKKHYTRLELIHWKCLFFQIISTLAVIQTKYPTFRHNDFKANNILICKVDKTNFTSQYTINQKKYKIPNIGYCIYIWDFDFACIPGIVENKKVYLNWTQDINISSKRNRYYDIHYFFCTLLYKGFLPEIMTCSNVPIQVKEFINYVLPKQYSPTNEKTEKPNKKVSKNRCRLLVDDEYLTPIDILNHEFFSEFKQFS